MLFGCSLNNDLRNIKIGDTGKEYLERYPKAEYWVDVINGGLYIISSGQNNKVYLFASDNDKGNPIIPLYEKFQKMGDTRKINKIEYKNILKKNISIKVNKILNKEEFDKLFQQEIMY